jgi:transposase
MGRDHLDGIQELVPNAIYVPDGFHVIRNFNEALDKARRE